MLEGLYQGEVMSDRAGCDCGHSGWLILKRCAFCWKRIRRWLRREMSPAYQMIMHALYRKQRDAMVDLFLARPACARCL